MSRIAPGFGLLLLQALCAVKPYVQSKTRMDSFLKKSSTAAYYNPP